MSRITRERVFLVMGIGQTIKLTDPNLSKKLMQGPELSLCVHAAIRPISPLFSADGARSRASRPSVRRGTRASYGMRNLSGPVASA